MMLNMMMPYRYNRSLRNDNRNWPSLLNDDFFRSFFAGSEPGTMKVDVEDKGDHYLMEADLPGIQRENLHVDVEDGILTIRAEISEDKEDKNRNYLCRERRYGASTRAFSLEGIREDGIQAEFKDGVLKLTLPKIEETPKPSARSIEIAC